MHLSERLAHHLNEVRSTGNAGPLGEVVGQELGEGTLHHLTDVVIALKCLWSDGKTDPGLTQLCQVCEGFVQGIEAGLHGPCGSSRSTHRSIQQLGRSHDDAGQLGLLVGRVLWLNDQAETLSLLADLRSRYELDHNAEPRGGAREDESHAGIVRVFAFLIGVCDAFVHKRTLQWRQREDFCKPAA